MAFECVYAVWDYYDGPRSGIGDFLGKAHHLLCEWNDAKDDYAETFRLTPIDEATLALAIEQESIWRDWEGAFHRGEVPQSTHPGLAGAETRYGQLDALIKTRLSNSQGHNRRAVASFRATSRQASVLPGAIRELEVQWTNIED